MPLDPNLDPMFDYAGRYYNVDPQHLKSIALAESSGNPDAESPAGAQGLMQLMPATAASLGVTDPKDPKQSILGGAQYYAQGLDKYNDPTKALMYYHGGPDESQWKEKTQAYPAQVAAAYAKLQQPPSGRPQVAQNTAQPLTGTDALAAVGGGQPPSPSAGSAPTSTQPQQVAQAAPGAMSDDELWNGFVKGTLPPSILHAPQAAPAIPQGGQIAPRSSAPTSQSLSPIDPAFIAHAEQQAEIDAALGRQSGPQITAAAGMAPGLPGSPEGQLLKAQVESAGNKQQYMTPSPTGGPPIVAPLPGSIAANAQAKGAESEAEQIPLRKTQAEQPRELRGPGSSMIFPPGSTGAQAFIDAQKSSGSLPPGTRVNNDGSVEVGNTNLTPEIINKRYDDLHALGTDAEAAREGIWKAQWLRQKLNDIGNTGPMTDKLAMISNLGSQLGVSPELLKRTLPPGATVAEAQKLSTDLLGDILHATFASSGGGRITNADITGWKHTVAQTTTPLEANNFLIDKIVIPKFARAVEKYNFATTLPAGDPQLNNYLKATNDWENAHPFNAYELGSQYKPGGNNIAPPQSGALGPAAPSFTEGQTIRNPTTGERRVFRGGQWAPMQ